MATKIPLAGVRGEIAALVSDEQQQPVAPADSAAILIYTVQPGDTLWALGGHFYGDPQGAEPITRALPA